ncbi:MAG: helix-turn-helix transcriptional regulator [Mogibacterium sp.]|nr:helix-turn-helix transcriptional regulator [Mogibacterium sp.]
MKAGQIVQTAREREGLTRKQLAAKTGLTYMTIQNIETGKTDPKMDTMLRIMQALNYDTVFNPRYRGGYYGE